MQFGKCLENQQLECRDTQFKLAQRSTTLPTGTSQSGTHVLPTTSLPTTIVLAKHESDRLIRVTLLHQPGTQLP